MKDYFATSPMSERTLARHNYKYKGFEYLNDFGFPCDYRVCLNGKELGRVKYYGGRKLSAYEVTKIKEM